mmetsp:Transcript_453/g.661  ORF Transcript_453/g.661 Transcript_453/m.661 type:complete len:130 (-) Transcript_453:349-738(-)
MVDVANEVADQQEDFDFNNIVLRRADPDDFDEIINLVEIGEDDIYNRVYSFPNILKLIETAYLAITVIDREGRVVAFAAFEDYPQVSRAASRWARWQAPTSSTFPSRLVLVTGETAPARSIATTYLAGT